MNSFYYINFLLEGKDKGRGWLVGVYRGIVKGRRCCQGRR
jgi:hypothetical protein